MPGPLGYSFGLPIRLELKRRLCLKLWGIRLACRSVLSFRGFRADSLFVFVGYSD